MKELFRKFSRDTMAKIQDAVAKECKISVQRLIDHDRRRPIAYARQLAMWLSRNLVGAPFVEIGKAFGGRDHSTVIKGIQNCDKFCSRHEDWAERRKKLIAMFENREKILNG